MKDACMFCQRRQRKSADFEDDVCQICAREFLLTNHSARCNSCKLFTVFRKGETQCLYCADDVSMHRKYGNYIPNVSSASFSVNIDNFVNSRETPILCSGCQSSSLGFARKSVSSFFNPIAFLVLFTNIFSFYRAAERQNLLLDLCIQ
jgi:hypothetical protein